MKSLFMFVFSILLLLSFVPRVFAQESILNSSNPSISIATPLDETVVAGRTLLQFSVENFELTPRPSNVRNQGVIAIYVDGKFYTNIASSSASVQFNKVGTHRVDAELVHTNRQLVLPRASDTIYLHNQKKLPFLSISNVRNGNTVYIPQPVLQITSRIEQYEDQNTYYQVFVNGVLDGDSTQSDNKESYLLKSFLREGRNSVRIALYGENGKPYSPVIDHLVELFYQTEMPALKSVEIEPRPSENSVNFELELIDFKVPENGFVLVKTGDREISYATASGTINDFGRGSNEITFTLVDINGFKLLPNISAKQSVSVGLQSEELTKTVIEQSVFTVGEAGSTTRNGLVGLALIQAIVILVFGSVLALRHSYHYR